MLFLITDKQKNKILDEYYSYLINIFSIGLVVLFVIFLIGLFPTYLTMRTDRQILTDKIAPLQSEIDTYKAQSANADSVNINNDIAVLNTTTTSSTLAIYKEIKGIYTEIPNAQLVSIQIDTLNKKITVVASIDSKNTAGTIVDRLNATRYKGANLPYSVFSQSRNFIFSQNLTYE
jgi:hypothetical protein